jgi:hypothetical protein
LLKQTLPTFLAKGDTSERRSYLVFNPTKTECRQSGDDWQAVGHRCKSECGGKRDGGQTAQLLAA